MSRRRISAALRAKVAADARHRCGYCLTTESVVGTPMDVEHIVPEAAGGESDEGNLWLGCALCNKFKGDRTHGRDPTTGKRVRLFDPRRQVWAEHFAWDGDGTRVVGRTPVGRATIEVLRLNRDLLVAAREGWVAAGWHPPPD